MFTVSEENTVKCLEDSSDIVGNGRTSSLVFGNLRQSLGIVGSLLLKFGIVVKWATIPLYTKQNNIGLFWSRFCFFLQNIYCFKEFFTVTVKMPKI